MKLTFDPSADAAYVMLVESIGRSESVHTEVCDVALDGAAIVMDFDVQRRLLGIEILGASRVLRPEALAAEHRLE